MFGQLPVTIMLHTEITFYVKFCVFLKAKSKLVLFPNLHFSVITEPGVVWK